MQKLKQIVLITLLSLTIVNPGLVFAAGSSSGGVSYETKYEGVDGSIKKYLCTPSNPSTGKDIENCINKLYRFGISFGAIALVFFIVLAGYMYITGGESGKAKAKGMLQNSLVGMAMLLGTYLLLGFINPNLLLFRSIQPPIFTAPDFASCADLGLGDGCIIASSGDGSSGVGNGNIVQIATKELGNHGGAAFEWKNYFIHTALANNTGPLIDKYFIPGGSPGDPWCAYFATWVYGQAGIKTIGTLPGRGGSLTLVSYFKNNNGKKIAEGTVKYIPAESIFSGSENVLPGDLALYDRGTSGDANGHTAIALGYDPATKTIASIDGNVDQSDTVARKNRNILAECTGKVICKLIGIGRVVR